MTTTKTTLSMTQWTQIATGPLLIDSPQLSNVALHFGDAAPAMDSTAYHTLVGPDALCYEGRQTCYARALNQNASVVVTSGQV